MSKQTINDLIEYATGRNAFALRDSLNAVGLDVVRLAEPEKPKFDPKPGEVYRVKGIGVDYTILDDGWLASNGVRRSVPFANRSAEKVFDPADEHEALPLPTREIQVGDRVWTTATGVDWTKTVEFTVDYFRGGYAYSREGVVGGRVEDLELVDPEPPTLPVGTIIQWGFDDHLDAVIAEGRTRCLDGAELEDVVDIQAIQSGKAKIVWLPES